MTASFILYISLIIAILLLVMLAKKINIAYPIVLVLGGLVLSLIPAIPNVEIDPEMIFLIFLPPLLYDAAWYTSWKSFWKYRRVIASFAFIIVIITSFVVAMVSSMIIPGFTLALGFLLGGIVSPPDAVAATTILKNVKVPKTVTVVLEGESLLNDAASLIVFRFALIAVDTGRFVFHEAAMDFIIVIAIGIAIGVAVAYVYFMLHKWLPTDSNIDTVLALTAPYVMYIAAEKFHFSGVLAVVSGGLFLSARSHIFLSHKSRLRGVNVWSALGFVLNGLVFMLIGLELPVIISDLGNVSLGAAIGYGLAISGVLIISRIICALGASAFTVFASKFITTAESHPGWRGPIIIGWAGMRGVVSLAAALSLPILLSNKAAFPERSLIIFITFTVILVTLVLQGLTLPLIIKWVNLKGPTNELPLYEQELEIKKILVEKSLSFLNTEYKELLISNKSLHQLQAKIETEQTVLEESPSEEHANFKKVYLQLLNKQRGWLLELNKKTDTDEELIRKHQGLIDLEEEKVRVRYQKHNIT